MEENSLKNMLMEVDFKPNAELIKVENKSTQIIPFDKLATNGIGLNSMVSTFQQFAQKGGSGLYYVNTHGKTMFNFKGKSAYLGSLKDATGGIAGQSSLYPAIDPTMICVAAVMKNINDKMDSILTAQREMKEFLELKEESALIGNVNVLSDILNNYKFNFENTVFRNTSFNIVQEIKREAEKQIFFYKERIKKNLEIRVKRLHSDKESESYILDTKSCLNDYQLGAYILSFSSFLEVVLLENFEENYLRSIYEKLKEYRKEFESVLEETKVKLQNISKTSVQAMTLKGVSKLTKNTGLLIENIPLLTKTKLNENLIKVSDKLESMVEERVLNHVNCLIEKSSKFNNPFIESVLMINKLYNSPLEIAFNEKELYITN